MEVKDIVDSVFKLVGLINAFWTVYATVTIALLGWLFASKTPWPWRQKLAISIAYGLMMALNCAAHYRINSALALVVAELQNEPSLSGRLKEAFAAGAPAPACLLLIVHLTVDAAVIWLIWIQERLHPPAAEGRR